MSALNPSVFDEIGNNFMFHLSTTSKESFHSDFLAVLAQKYPKAFWDILGLNPNEYDEVKSVQREKDRLDLQFTLKNGKQIIIENKFKSIPYHEQLLKYSERYPKAVKVLISVHNPIFAVPENGTFMVEQYEWRFLNYHSICQKLNKLLQAQTFSKNDAVYVRQYVQFTDAIVRLSDFYFDHPVENYLKKPYKLSGQIHFDKLRELRIADLFKKKHAHIIQLILMDKVKELYKSRGLTNIREGIDKWQKSEEKDLFVGWALTNSEGLLDVKIGLGGSAILGIQLQSGQYRHVYEDQAPEDATTSMAGARAEKLLASGLWFRFPTDWEENGRKNLVFRTYDTFAKDRGMFKYQYRLIPEGATVGQVLEKVMSDIIYALDHMEEIRQALRD